MRNRQIRRPVRKRVQTLGEDSKADDERGMVTP